jgi:trimeric autotransporter adhesin
MVTSSSVSRSLSTIRTGTASIFSSPPYPSTTISTIGFSSLGIRLKSTLFIYLTFLTLEGTSSTTLNSTSTSEPSYMFIQSSGNSFVSASLPKNITLTSSRTVHYTSSLIESFSIITSNPSFSHSIISPTSTATSSLTTTTSLLPSSFYNLAVSSSLFSSSSLGITSADLISSTQSTYSTSIMTLYATADKAESSRISTSTQSLLSTFSVHQTSASSSVTPTDILPTYYDSGNSIFVSSIPPSSTNTSFITSDSSSKTTMLFTSIKLPSVATISVIPSSTIISSTVTIVPSYSEILSYTVSFSPVSDSNQMSSSLTGLETITLSTLQHATGLPSPLSPKQNEANMFNFTSSYNTITDLLIPTKSVSNSMTQSISSSLSSSLYLESTITLSANTPLITSMEKTSTENVSSSSLSTTKRLSRDGKLSESEIFKSN